MTVAGWLLGGLLLAQSPAAGADACAGKTPEACQADLEFDRGEAALARGATLAARRLFERSLSHARTAGSAAREARAAGRLADTALTLGEDAAYLEYSRLAFERSPAKSDGDRADYMTRVGAALAIAQDTTNGIKYLEDALALATKLPDALRAARAHYQLGFLFAQNDLDLPRAGTHHQAGLALLEGRTDPEALSLRAFLLNGAGNVHRADPARQDVALRAYMAALPVAREHNPSLAPIVLKNIGRILRQTGRPQEARPYIDEAIALADATGKNRARWLARMELGLLLESRDPQQAEAAYRAAIDRLEAQYYALPVTEDRAGAIATEVLRSDNPFDLLIDLLVRQNRPGEAFAVAERHRARAFLDTLAQARDALAETAPREFVEREALLLRHISDRQAALRDRALDAKGRGTQVAALDGAEQELAGLRLQLAPHQPATDRAALERLFTLAGAKQALEPSSALVAFHVGAARSIAWVIRPDGLSTAQLPGRAALTRLANDAMEAWQSPQSDPRQATRALSAAVLSPIAGALAGVQRIVIVPDGPLHAIPFGALQDDLGVELIDRAVIAYAPSAASLAFLRNQPGGKGTGVIAIGNPVLTASGAEATRGSDGIRQLAWLKPLPYSGEEIRAVSRVFGGATALEQREATEAALDSDAARRAAIVHLATHGFVDGDQPERSGLALTAAPPLSDGVLQAREIYNLKLQAALVTLSACKTARGRMISGEGIMGLSRAFFYAGAGSVVATLWDVNDASTSQLMTFFYEGIRAGEPIDTAMRAAQLRLRKDPAFRHPYFWAPFVAIGRADRPIDGVLPRSSTVPGAAGGALALLIAAFSARVRSSRPAGGRS